MTVVDRMRELFAAFKSLSKAKENPPNCALQQG
jgi:hypothetical protein